MFVARDEPDVDGAGPVLADPADLLLLEQAEQLGLEGKGQIADLVEKERPLVGVLDEPGLVPERPGERAADVPEELALEKLVRDGPAVDGDEPAARSGPRDSWIARAMSSFPVPLSPAIRTGASRSLTLSMSSRTRAKAADRPTIGADAGGSGAE